MYAPLTYRAIRKLPLTHLAATIITRRSIIVWRRVRASQMVIQGLCMIFWSSSVYCSPSPRVYDGAANPHISLPSSIHRTPPVSASDCAADSSPLSSAFDGHRSPSIIPLEFANVSSGRYSCRSGGGLGTFNRPAQRDHAQPSYPRQSQCSSRRVPFTCSHAALATPTPTTGYDHTCTSHPCWTSTDV